MVYMYDWIKPPYQNDKMLYLICQQVWYNNKGWFAVVAYMSAMNNLILRSNLDPALDPTRYGITTVNHPMELTKNQLNEQLL